MILMASIVCVFAICSFFFSFLQLYFVSLAWPTYTNTALIGFVMTFLNLSRNIFLKAKGF